ncbi:MAG: crossover junction endodeoxyribonuclease RuvC [Gammaproteobacteria bacterium]|jgi:crossover junction endodeoxyribonuclease RuvC
MKANSVKRILGIDPGSRFTGYGIVDLTGDNKISWVASGCIRVKGDNLPHKLCIIAEGLNELLDIHQPDEVAIEQVFLHRNVDSALKLGQARGAAISTVALRALPVSEYSPSQIKKSVVGKGNAAKEQVQHMMKALLRLSRIPQEDAADALAIAVCHAQNCHTQGRVSAMSQGTQSLSGLSLRRSSGRKRWRL